MAPIRTYYKTLICRLLGGIPLLFLVFSLSCPGAVAAQAATSATQPHGAARLSKKEAEELFRSIDDILQFASQDTELPIRHNVKRELSSRDEVAQNLNDRLK